MLLKQALALLFVAASTLSSAQVAIGEWRDHFPYNSTLAVVEGVHPVLSDYNWNDPPPE